MLNDMAELFRRMLQTRLFRILVCIDITLIALYLLSYLLVNRGILTEIPDAFQLARERSVPEYLSYAKWAFSALALAWCCAKTRQIHFGALALIFAIVAADDALMFHETYGWVVAEKLNIPFAFAMDPKEIGESIVFCLLGALALLLLAVAFVTGDSAGKVLVCAILLTILGLGVTGVLFDAFHHMSAEVGTPRFRRLLVLFFTVIEDGGETILGSVILGLSALCLRDARTGELAVARVPVRR